MDKLTSVADKAAIAAAIDEYCLRRTGDIDTLKGHPGWLRLRVGNHRIAFQILKSNEMDIPLIGDRKEIYALARGILP